MGNNFLDSRGFIMLNVVFLTLIVSFAAMIYLNGSAIVGNSNATLRLTALNLMNEQFAEIESLAGQGNLSAGEEFDFLGLQEDLISYNASEKNPTEFKVTAAVKNFDSENLLRVSVKVTWKFNGRNFELESEKLVRVRRDE